MNRRVLIQITEFMGGRPLITTATIGAEIKFSLQHARSKKQSF
jgi:hypothetical protein